MYGADWCRDCRRSEALLNELGIDWVKVDIEESAEAAQTAQSISGRMNIPVVHFPDGTFHVEPSDADLKAKVEALARRLGRTEPQREVNSPTAAAGWGPSPLACPRASSVPSSPLDHRFKEESWASSTEKSPSSPAAHAAWAQHTHAS